MEKVALKILDYPKKCNLDYVDNLNQISYFGGGLTALMISLHFCDKPVIDFKSAMNGNNIYFKNYFHAMLKEGVYLPPSPFESYFLNDALSFEDIDCTLRAFKKISKNI